MAPTLLIDVDGTISDSLAGIQASFRTAMAAVDHPLPDDAFLSTLAGPPMRDSMARIGLAGERLDEAMRAYRAEQTDGGWADTRMFPGWAELLDGWRADGIRLATATSKGGHFARKVLAEFGILDRFDFIGANTRCACWACPRTGAIRATAVWATAERTTTARASAPATGSPAS